MSKYSIKQYQTMLDKKKAEYETLLTDLRSIQDKIALNKIEQKTLNQELYKLKDKQVEPVTEHAILRYLERVQHLDLDPIRKHIMEMVSAIYPYNGEVKSVQEDGSKIRYIVKDKQVVTIVD